MILETDAMRESGSSLKRALQAHGIRVRRIPVDDATAESIERSADSVAVELGERQRPLVLNVTGSHPLLALALVEKLSLADPVPGLPAPQAACSSRRSPYPTKFGGVH